MDNSDLPPLDTGVEIPTKCRRCPNLDSAVLAYAGAGMAKDQLVELGMDAEATDGLAQMLVEKMYSSSGSIITQEEAMGVIRKQFSEQVGAQTEEMDGAQKFIEELTGDCDGLQETTHKGDRARYFLLFCGSAAIAPYLMKQPVVVERMPFPRTVEVSSE